MYSLIRTLLFKIDPEKAHHFSFGAIRLFEILGLTRIIRALWVPRDRALRKEVMGIAFDSPVGLAAGFDKNALLYNAFSDFGFGFVEIGTVTPKAQPGNPKKRLFRLKGDRALIN
ncbi:MAG: dihydroorotate dehydrogenase (quinone), partial [Flavobacteriia bacterium]|nr:dihydroorotate dehydrogenase (quinone) [Flavobacteriia bacterium]